MADDETPKFGKERERITRITRHSILHLQPTIFSTMGFYVGVKAMGITRENITLCYHT